MADDNGNTEEPKLTVTQQIVQHAVSKEPSKMKSLVHKEISSRVMGHIETKRTKVGTDLFGR